MMMYDQTDVNDDGAMMGAVISLGIMSKGHFHKCFGH